MRLLVVGATGGLGRETVAAASARGHVTVALTRRLPEAPFPADVQIARGDVLDPSSLTAAVGNSDAVICALGTPSPRRPSTLLRDGTQNLVDAMAQAGVRRLVCVTLLGIEESAVNTSVLYRQAILRFLAPMVPDKQAQERVVRGSGLDWTLVRPPRFAGGKPRGDVRVIREGERGRLGHVVRPDLARFLVECATEGRYMRQAVAAGS
jgi:uncharacterized protein YbjT (DUF2867 family)